MTPELDGGRHPIKAVTGETVVVEADIFTDGHEKIACAVKWRPEDQSEWTAVPMVFRGNDRWAASFMPMQNIHHFYTVEAWRDPFASLLDGIIKKRAAGQTLSVESEEAVDLVGEAEGRGEDREALKALVARLHEAEPASEEQLDAICEPATKALMDRCGPRHQVSCYDELLLVVDRKAAVFSAWYELFPRSCTDSADRHGTFRDVIAHLPYVQDLGFDVLYFPPIHPIGRKNRKGKNNTLTPTDTDVGSVYAIGSAEGGHDAIHPQLGTLEDFRALVAAAKEHGLEIALDFAIQCSPDHPWITEHPEWFVWRSDGTIQYAENPPKKYEDIVNVDFYGAEAMPALWKELRDVILYWVREGVRILRVDNPHTKPLPFWRWLIAEVNRQYPDVLFLAEAFTRPAMMRELAKIGYQQSYTYFTWRNEKWEIEQYIAELAGPMGDYYRPNFFVNTPDINPVYLQTGGRAGHLVRATLAATLSGAWGVYSGFELCEARALPGREEYVDSEKYEVKVWDYDRPGNIKDYVRRLNAIRRENEALHDFRNAVSLRTTSDQIIAYAKFSRDRTNCILVMVNLDPRNRQGCSYEIPLWEWGLPDSGSLDVEDLLGGYRFTLHGKTHQIALDPFERSAVIWRLAPPADWKGGR